ncbi:hypothetical protein WDU94_004138 [Cyamophila willieti]
MPHTHQSLHSNEQKYNPSSTNNGNRAYNNTNNNNNNNNNIDYLNISSGPRSLSDSSTAESPVGNNADDIILPNQMSNGHHMSSMASSFHHHHVHHHHHNPGYHSTYPVLPASLLYSQLYSHAGGSNSTDFSSLSSRNIEDERCSAAIQRTHSVADHTSVWRPY